MNNTATSIRYEATASAMARQRLTEHPECQAESIARHYVAHATLALEMLRLIEAKRSSDNSTDLDAAIELHMAYIKRNHRYDFGIELDWPK